MCIVLITTAHPSYALIVVDNRDEFILRPTSRPHWWSCHCQDILSARDLHRAEQGTWLGVTKTGKFAVLTNFREIDTQDPDHPVQGERSRGGMVTAWLTSPEDENTVGFVQRLLDGGGVKGVGGFSLICGKLRKRLDSARQELEPLAVISNRCEQSKDVPWIADQRNGVYGLSNTHYMDPITWPKLATGKKLLADIVDNAIAEGWDEEQLVEKLYCLLSTDTLPIKIGHDFEQYVPHLRESIFIPPIGGAEAAPNAEDNAAASEAGRQSITNGHKQQIEILKDQLKQEERPDSMKNGATTGCYGTHRQTIVLVDWNGKVTFRERALWDEHGRPIPKGKGDMKFEFKIEGWHSESIDHEV